MSDQKDQAVHTDPAFAEREKKIHLHLAEVFMNLGNLYKARSKYDKAQMYYELSQKHCKKAFTPIEEWNQMKKKQRADTSLDAAAKRKSVIYMVRSDQELQRREDELNRREKDLQKREEQLNKTPAAKKEVKVLTEEERLKKVEEDALLRLEEAKKKMEQEKAKFEKWQSESHQEQQPSGTSGFFARFGNLGLGGSVRKKEIGEIGVPINVTHEGHIGFDKTSGGFQTRNLPTEYQQLFDNLNQTLTKMGVAGITEKEAKLLLRSIPVVMAGKGPAPQKKPAVISDNPAVLQKEIANLQKMLDQRDKEIEVLEAAKRSLEQRVQSGGAAIKESQPAPPAPRAPTLQVSQTSEVPMPPPPPPPAAPQAAKTERPRKAASVSEEPSGDAGNARQALLDAIKGPKTNLKHVDGASAQSKPAAVDADDQNVLNLIAKALIDRRNQISDDKEEEEEDNLDEWL
eukprot:TRINITY_DN5176_c0_g1_i1.p1 TRINITY_DN5176_c0_g1~~TRINITY_DN5176_c0_g1_i1.p1  ORF type:complete len:476 (+),score=132.19 TRINITY_DN5176_c0_g1_i1:56-1429(+)